MRTIQMNKIIELIGVRAPQILNMHHFETELLNILKAFTSEGFLTFVTHSHFADEDTDQSLSGWLKVLRIGAKTQNKLSASFQTERSKFSL